MARKTIYKKEFDELAYNYCLLGATDAQLAQFFEVTEQTINNWKKSHKSFFESIKRGKVQADAQVAQALYHRATGYSHKEIKLAINEGRFTDEKEVMKHYPPDVTAIIFWLKNRQRELWRDKQEVAHSVESNDMTDEQIKEELKRLEEM